MTVSAVGEARWARVAGAIVLLLLSACASVDRNVALTQQAVIPVPVGEAADVSALHLAEAMLRSGLTHEQIVRHGPAIHEALATSGGAQFRAGKLVEAVFAVRSDHLYVTSRTRGTFVMPLDGSAS
jgi:hypothetical protein